jgi:hypothetical protein
MRRSELLRTIRRQARASGVEVIDKGGAAHQHLVVGSVNIRVPRHIEISNGVTQQLLHALQAEFGNGWWR